MAACNALRHNVHDRVLFVRADVARFLHERYDAGDLFDVVIKDPPKFAPNALALDRAITKNRRINEDAIRVVRASGLLVTCTCSAALSQEKGRFVDVVAQAASAAGRQVV